MIWNLVIVAVVLLIALVVQSTTPQQKPPELQEFETPTAEEGREIPVVFGRVLLKSVNVVWYGNFRYRKIKTSSGK